MKSRSGVREQYTSISERKMTSVAEIVKKLVEASDAYYNTGVPILTDDEYDSLREKLESLDPKNPYLTAVGAGVKSGAVALPAPMPSLNKIKPGTPVFASWLNSSRGSEWILSEKLDGISALWIPREKKLYLRGDGLTGQDVSHVVSRGVKGLPLRLERGFMVRGELVITKADTPAGTIGRSWINGLLHQKEPAPEKVALIRFVAYEILSDSTKRREEQFSALKKMGYELPWWTKISAPTEEILASSLQARRTQSPYDTDGIVVGKNQVPEWHGLPAGTLQNPKDMVAFKMVLADQCAETRVVKIHWAVSYQGYYIPRLEIEPVRVGEAVITYVTGHNAKVIAEKKLGAGARIRVRRSGDVIPCIDGVLEPAAAPDFPDAALWAWDENGVHIRQKEGTAGKELKESKLRHFVDVLEIDRIGPGLVKKLVEGGVDEPRKLLAAESARLSELLGPTTGATLFTGLRKAMSGVTEKQLMLASGCMPRGVGDTKLTSLFKQEADPRRWSSIVSAEGWSKDALVGFLPTMATYEEWRRSQVSGIPYPILAVPAPAPAQIAEPVKSIGGACFTGFRDSAVEEELKRMGYTIQAAVNKVTKILLVPDAADLNTQKIQKARDLGVKILRRSTWREEIKTIV